MPRHDSLRGVDSKRAKKSSQKTDEHDPRGIATRAEFPSSLTTTGLRRPRTLTHRPQPGTPACLTLRHRAQCTPARQSAEPASTMALLGRQVLVAARSIAGIAWPARPPWILSRLRRRSNQGVVLCPRGCRRGRGHRLLLLPASILTARFTALLSTLRALAVPPLLALPRPYASSLGARLAAEPLPVVPRPEPLLAALQQAAPQPRPRASWLAPLTALPCRTTLVCSHRGASTPCWSASVACSYTWPRRLPSNGSSTHPSQATAGRDGASQHQHIGRRK